MKEYYVVYDQTPYDERGEKYNQIGIGYQNKGAEMLKRHYDYSKSNSGNFHPTTAAMDSSHTIVPYPSVYVIDKIANEIPDIMPAPKN